MKKLFILVSTLFISHAAIAQIPNGDFETWTNMGSYYTPDGWDNLNSMTSTMSTYTCNKGNPGYSGSSYLQLISKTVMGMGVMPGVAVSGAIDFASFGPKYGFPFASRPGTLTGAWQYMGFSGDQARIVVYLSKWNAGMGMRDTVAYTDTSMSGMVMSWGMFSIPVKYRSAATPDSAIIVLSSSGSIPANNSYLYIDALAFSGSPTGIAGVAEQNMNWTVFPNPATNAATINYISEHAGDVKMLIADITGKCVKGGTFHVSTGENKFTVDLSGLTSGIYSIRLANGLFAESRKLVIE